jgi:hypothetical protein
MTCSFVTIRPSGLTIVPVPNISSETKYPAWSLLSSEDSISILFTSIFTVAGSTRATSFSICSASATGTPLFAWLIPLVGNSTSRQRPVMTIIVMASDYLRQAIRLPIER